MVSDNSSTMVLQPKTIKDQLNVMDNIIPVVTELNQAYDLHEREEMGKMFYYSEIKFAPLNGASAH